MGLQRVDLRNLAQALSVIYVSILLNSQMLIWSLLPGFLLELQIGNKLVALHDGPHSHHTITLVNKA